MKRVGPNNTSDWGRGGGTPDPPYPPYIICFAICYCLLGKDEKNRLLNVVATGHANS